MKKVIVQDADFMSILLFLPCIATAFAALGIGIYWFGKIATSRRSFKVKMTLERILICYVIASTSLALLSINQLAVKMSQSQYVLCDVVCLDMILSFLGFIFTTIFVLVKTIVFWSDALHRGQKNHQWYLAILPLWLCCFLCQMISYFLVMRKII
ncbi:hypothetical protein [Sphingobacterium thalpophilum]|uniref:hypothetical protein n=1 Tax=Sphingobacterium thalpophilum TaxID=259 RepID=UPI0024A761FB|nr:hypothetical protein [Sphingobacterium thalpophilum]